VYINSSPFKFQLKLNSAGSRRIPDPSPLFGDPTPKLGDPLEFRSAMSLLVITHHDRYKYAFKTFPFQYVAMVDCGGGLGDLVNDEYRLAGRKVLGTRHPSFYGLNCPLSTGSTRHRFGARPAVGG